MTRHNTTAGSRSKEIRAWGIRRREVDINQLALAYYLLARIRIEEQRQSAASSTTSDDTEAKPSSEAA
jgi:ribosomal protein S6